MPKVLEDFDVKPDKIKPCQITIEKRKQVCAVFQKIFELSGTNAAVKCYAFGDLTVEKICNANDRTGGRARTLAKELLTSVLLLLSPGNTHDFVLAMDKAIQEAKKEESTSGNHCPDRYSAS